VLNYTSNIRVIAIRHIINPKI